MGVILEPDNHDDELPEIPSDLSKPVKTPPVMANPYEALIKKHAAANNLDDDLIGSMAGQESNWKPGATSWTGKHHGLLQTSRDVVNRFVKPNEFGTMDPKNPEVSIAAGTRYMRWLLDRYNGNTTRALAGYNAGEGNADKPDWEQRMQTWSNDPKVQAGLKPRGASDKTSTANYTQKIQSNYQKTLPDIPNGVEALPDIPLDLGSAAPLVRNAPLAPNGKPFMRPEDVGRTVIDPNTPNQTVVTPPSKTGQRLEKIQDGDNNEYTLAKDQSGLTSGYRYTRDVDGKPANFIIDGTTIKREAPNWISGATAPKTDIPKSIKSEYDRAMQQFEAKDTEEFRQKFLTGFNDDDNQFLKHVFVDGAAGTRARRLIRNAPRSAPRGAEQNGGSAPQQGQIPRSDEPQTIQPAETAAGRMAQRRDLWLTQGLTKTPLQRKYPSRPTFDQIFEDGNDQTYGPEWREANAAFQSLTGAQLIEKDDIGEKWFNKVPDHYFNSKTGKLQNVTSTFSPNIKRLVDAYATGGKKAMWEMLMNEAPSADMPGWKESMSARDQYRTDQGERAAEATVKNEFAGQKPSTWDVAEKAIASGFRVAKDNLISPFYGAYTAMSELQDQLAQGSNDGIRLQKQLDDIRESGGPTPFTDFIRNRKELAEMSGPEYAARVGAEFGRSVINTAVSDGLKGLDFIDSLNEKYNPIMMAIPDPLKPSLRNVGNGLAYAIAYLKDPKTANNLEFVKSSDGAEKRLFYALGNRLQDALGNDSALSADKSPLSASKMAQGFGSSAGFMVLGLLAPEMSVATRLGEFSITSALSGALTQAGSGYEEGLKAGFKGGKADFYGAMQGILGASEGFGIGASVNRAIKNAELRQMFTRNLIDFATGTGKTFFKGGIEEGLQEFFQNTGGRAVMDALKDRDPSSWKRLKNIIDRLPAQAAKSTVTEAPSAFLTGGLTEGAFHAVSGLHQEGPRVDLKNNLLEFNGQRYAFSDETKPVVEEWIKAQNEAEALLTKVDELREKASKAKTFTEKKILIKKSRDLQDEIAIAAGLQNRFFDRISADLSPVEGKTKNKDLSIAPKDAAGEGVTGEDMFTPSTSPDDMSTGSQNVDTYSAPEDAPSDQFFHKQEGIVQAVKDQKGVPAGKVRVEVIDGPNKGKQLVIQRPDGNGRGNNYATPVKVKGLSFGQQQEAKNTLTPESKLSGSQVSESKPTEEGPEGFRTGSALWKTDEAEEPVVVTGYAGEIGGRRMVTIEGQEEAIPLDQLEYPPKPKVQVRPGRIVDIKNGGKGRIAEIRKKKVGEGYTIIVDHDPKTVDGTTVYQKRSFFDPEDLTVGGHAITAPEAREPRASKQAPEAPTITGKGADEVDDSLKAAQPRISLGDAELHTLPKSAATQKLTTQAGTSIEVTPAIVDERNIITSFKPGFPKELQPRKQDRDASTLRIERYKNELDPSRLGDNFDPGLGRPILVPVTVDGERKYFALTANHRLAAIERIYQNDMPKAGKYRKFAISQKGIDETEGSDRPVYAAVINDPSAVDLVKLAEEANEGTNRMGAAEQAVVDARKLNLALLDQFRPNDDGFFNNSENADFIRKFHAHIVPELQQGDFLTQDGKLSQAGIIRVRNAVFAKAFAGSEEGVAAIAKLSEDPSNNIRNVTNGLVRSVGGLAQLKALTEEDKRFAHLDITDDVAKAIAKFAYLREKGQSVERFLEERPLPGMPEMSVFQKRILQTLDTFKKSQNQIAGVFHNYVAAVDGIGNPDQIDIFGETPDVQSYKAPELFRAAVEAVEEGIYAKLEETHLSEPVERREPEPEARPEREKPAQKTVASDGDKAGTQGKEIRIGDTVTEAAHEAATSPKNDLPEPTQAQKEAGNYKKGHILINGLDISIENPVGSKRSGTDANGKKWSVTMKQHYGYIKRTEGADGEHIDVFVKDGTPEDFSGDVYVIDQIDPKTGKFDEHKVMLGFSTAHEAEKAYLSNYAKDWQGRGPMLTLAMDNFKNWLTNADTTRPALAKVLGLKEGLEDGSIEEVTGNAEDLTYGKTNTVFTEDAAEKARRLLREKLGKHLKEDADTKLSDEEVAQRINEVAEWVHESGLTLGEAMPYGEAASKILSDIQDPYVQEVASALSDTLKKINTDLTLTIDPVANGKALGAFDSPTNEIVLGLPAIARQGGISAVQRVFLHETIHAITAHQIDPKEFHYQDGAFAKVIRAYWESKEQREARRQLYRLLDFLRTQRSLKGEYGLTNVHELMAEAFSESTFANKLKKIRIPADLRFAGKDQSAFENIIDRITKFLHDLVKAVTGKSLLRSNAFTSLRNLIDEYARTYDPKQRAAATDAANRYIDATGRRVDPLYALDPEMTQAGITLAGYHVEAGAKTFADYAEKMLEDLGPAVEPFLKSWYMAVKYNPDIDASGMDDEAAVDKYLDKTRDKPSDTTPTNTVETTVTSDKTPDKRADKNISPFDTPEKWETARKAYIKAYGEDPGAFEPHSTYAPIELDEGALRELAGMSVEEFGIVGEIERFLTDGTVKSILKAFEIDGKLSDRQITKLHKAGENHGLEKEIVESIIGEVEATRDDAAGGTEETASGPDSEISPVSNESSTGSLFQDVAEPAVTSQAVNSEGTPIDPRYFETGRLTNEFAPSGDRPEDLKVGDIFMWRGKRVRATKVNFLQNGLLSTVKGDVLKGFSDEVDHTMSNFRDDLTAPETGFSIGEPSRKQTQSNNQPPPQAGGTLFDMGGLDEEGLFAQGGPTAIGSQEKPAATKKKQLDEIKEQQEAADGIRTLTAFHYDNDLADLYHVISRSESAPRASAAAKEVLSRREDIRTHEGMEAVNLAAIAGSAINYAHEAEIRGMPFKEFVENAAIDEWPELDSGERQFYDAIADGTFAELFHKELDKVKAGKPSDLDVLTHEDEAEKALSPLDQAIEDLGLYFTDAQALRKQRRLRVGDFYINDDNELIQVESEDADGTINTVVEYSSEREYPIEESYKGIEPFRKETGMDFRSNYAKRTNTDLEQDSQKPADGVEVRANDVPAERPETDRSDSNVDEHAPSERPEPGSSQSLFGDSTAPEGIESDSSRRTQGEDRSAAVDRERGGSDALSAAGSADDKRESSQPREEVVSGSEVDLDSLFDELVPPAEETVSAETSPTNFLNKEESIRKAYEPKKAETAGPLASGTVVKLTRDFDYLRSGEQYLIEHVGKRQGTTYFKNQRSGGGTYLKAYQIAAALKDGTIQIVSLPEPKTKKATAPRQTKTTATPQDKIESAADSAKKGLDDTISGLGKLFGDDRFKGSMFPAFDEETYAQAKPLFLSAYNHFKDAAKDIADAMRLLIAEMRKQGHTDETLRRMKPYIVRFVADIRDGVVGQEEEKNPIDTVEQPESKEAETKLEQQLRAESIPVKLRDPDNIRATLPILFDEQANDVAFVENAFNSPRERFTLDKNGKEVPLKLSGAMITNGTGTGKTYSGLGVVKRFAKQGKDSILIVAPSQEILNAWSTASRNFNLLPKQLLSTEDNGGQGIVMTTYANLQQNPALIKRKWDLIVTDESHKLMSNAQGELTSFGQALRAITLHKRGQWDYARQASIKEQLQLDALERDLETELALLARYEDEGPQMAERAREKRINVAKLTQQADALRNKIQKIKDAAINEWTNRRAAEPQSNVLFLSATPYSYHSSLEYTEGYLFDYDEGKIPDKDLDRTRRYNEPNNQEAFMIQHLGYRMRYNKLTRPSADVDQGLMERQFNSWLKEQGVLSGRMLGIDKDYSRDFVLVQDAIGQKIDEGLEFISRGEQGKYAPLDRYVRGNFKYLPRTYLLEAMKAKAAIPIIRKHVELGRKVVVFHNYNVGGGFHPFHFDVPPNQEVEYNIAGRKVKVKLGELLADFRAARPDLIEMDFSGLVRPIEAFRRAFPESGDIQYVELNGMRTKKENADAIRLFNLDGSGVDVILVQADKGQAGISLHDTTGKHQRVSINLGLPVKPVEAIQEEGRIYRVGNQSDAIQLYMNTGTWWERDAFASRMAERAGTAENLSLGEDARSLKESMVESFLNPMVDYEPHADEGKGGKEKDGARQQALSAWDKAKTFYFGNQQKTSKNKSEEGVDYYPTPEPVGLKMVEWANLKPAESALEPSAGHGAIGRWFPETTRNTFIEPERELLSRLKMHAAGHSNRFESMQFEDLDVGANKFDAIVMNPPYGSASKTAIDHLEKAFRHLHDGGRVVALVPNGPSTDKRLEKLLYGNTETENIYKRGEIILPDFTFKRAGTSVRTKILIFDKVSSREAAANLEQSNYDLTYTSDIKQFFDELEDLDMPPRVAAPTGNAIYEDTVSAHKEYDAGMSRFEKKEFNHTKTGEPIYVALLKEFSDDFKVLKSAAQRHDGYYSSYKGSGAIPGFHFKTAEARDAFIGETDGDQSMMSIREEQDRMAAVRILRDLDAIDLVPTASLVRQGDRIKINLMGMEILRRAKEQVDVNRGRRRLGSEATHPVFMGLFTDPKTLRDMATVLRSAAAEAKENGFPDESKKLENFAGELDAAGKVGQGTAVFYVLDSKLPQEIFHQASYQAATEKALSLRHARPGGLDAHPAMKIAYDAFFSKQAEYMRMKPDQRKAIMREELAAWIAEGDPESLRELGLEGHEDLADEYLLDFFESFADKVYSDAKREGKTDAEAQAAADEALKRFGEIDYVKDAVQNTLSTSRLFVEESAGQTSGQNAGDTEIQDSPGEAGGATTSAAKPKFDLVPRDVGVRKRITGDASELGVTGKKELASLPGTQRAAGIAADDVLYTVFDDRSAQKQAQALIEKHGIAGTIQLLESTESSDVHHAIASFAIQRMLYDEAVRIEITNPAQAKRLTEIAMQMAANQSLRMVRAGRFIRAAGVIMKTVPSVIESAKRIYEEKHGKGEMLPDDVVRRIEVKAREAESTLAENEALAKQVDALKREIMTIKKALAGDPNFRRAGKHTLANRKKLVTQVKNRHQAAVEQALQRLNSRALIKSTFSVADELSLMSVYDDVNLSPDLMDDFANVGAMILTEGLASQEMMRPGDFDEKMRSIFGDGVDAHLEAIHRESLRRRNEWIADLAKEQAVKSIVKEFGEDISEEEIEAILLEREDELKRRQIIMQLHKLRAERGGKTEAISAIESIIAKMEVPEASAIAAVELVHKKPSAHELYRTLEALGIKGADAREALREGADILEKARLIYARDKAQADAELRRRLEASEDDLKDLDELRLQAKERARQSQSEIAKELQRIQSGETRFYMSKLMELLNTSRALMASTDASFIFRQGGWFMFARPKQQRAAFKAMVDAFAKTMEDTGYEKAMEEMERNPYFQLAVRSGIDFAGLGKHGEHSITKGEEEFRNNILRNVPLVGYLTGMSERTYVAFLDAQRLATFAQTAEMFEQQGLSFEENPKEFRAIAEYINDATGRSTIGSERIANLVMNLPLFAPRFTISRFKLLYKSTLGLAMAPPHARSVIMRDAAQVYGATSAILTLAWLLGLGVTLDWDDDDFLKIKIGNGHHDLFMGMQQPLRAMLRSMTAIGRKVLGSTYSAGLFRDSLYLENDKGQVLLNEFRHDMFGGWESIPGRFFRSKLGPLPSLAVDWGMGEDFNHDEFSWGKAIVSRILPLAPTEIVKTTYQGGPLEGIGAIPSAFGTGFNYYKDWPEQPTTPAEKLAKTINSLRMPDKQQSAEDKVINQQIAQLKVDVRTGIISEEAFAQQIKAMNDAGAITRRRATGLINGADDDYFESKVKRMPTLMLERVREVANESEKELIDQILDYRNKKAAKKGPEKPLSLIPKKEVYERGMQAAQ